MKTKILLVDDDPNIRQLVNLYLKKEDYDVVLADRGDTALEKFKSDAPNLILLDLMLPGMDGWQVLREIRKTSNVPIIMLTAKDETFDKVLGLELGADDYVAKPFEPKELLARIKAVLRRFQPAEPDSRDLSFPGLTISLAEPVQGNLSRQASRNAAEGTGAALFPSEPSAHGIYPRAIARAGLGL